MASTFVTLFPICENVHLTKDLGQIPYFLHTKHGYDAAIVSYKNSETYSNLEGEVKGLNMQFIPNTGRISFLEKSVLRYLFKHARQIDVLNLYIYSKFSFVYGILYKWRNPNGFLFLKLDGYNETFADESPLRHSTNALKNSFLKSLERRFLKHVNLVTIENSTGETLVKQKLPAIAHKTMYLPVGVNDLFLKEAFPRRKTVDEKENIILTVGRIGEEIKNHFMLLRALAATNLRDWRMVFVGPENPEFRPRYNAWIAAYPELAGKIEFTGEIRDRKTLYEWYDRAKVFCMTSWKESFCHSIGEALYFGNYIIGTEGIVSMKDLSNDGEFGVILKPDDDKALSTQLQHLINHPEFLRERCPRIMAHSDRNFTWSKIIDKVHERIAQHQHA